MEERDNDRGSQYENNALRSLTRPPQSAHDEAMLDLPISFLAMSLVSLISRFKKDNDSGHAN